MYILETLEILSVRGDAASTIKVSKKDELLARALIADELRRCGFTNGTINDRADEAWQVKLHDAKRINAIQDNIRDSELDKETCQDDIDIWAYGLYRT